MMKPLTFHGLLSVMCCDGLCVVVFGVRKIPTLYLIRVWKFISCFLLVFLGSLYIGFHGILWVCGSVYDWFVVFDDWFYGVLRKALLKTCRKFEVFLGEGGKIRKSKVKGQEIKR